jgi:hypothetical protein
MDLPADLLASREAAPPLRAYHDWQSKRLLRVVYCVLFVALFIAIGTEICMDLPAAATLHNFFIRMRRLSYARCSIPVMCTSIAQGRAHMGQSTTAPALVTTTCLSCCDPFPLLPVANRSGQVCIRQRVRVLTKLKVQGSE